MDICRATLSVAPNLVRLAHEAYWHYIARIDRPSAPMLAYFAHHITDDTVFIATNDMICGYLVLCHDPACWRLDNIARCAIKSGEGYWGGTNPALRILYGRMGGVVSYQLYTNELMHENIDWYRNSGFREIARREEHGFKRVCFKKTIHQP